MIEDDIRNNIKKSTIAINRDYLRSVSLITNTINDPFKYRFYNRFVPNMNHYKIPLSLFEMLFELDLSHISNVQYGFRESWLDYKTTAPILKNGILPPSNNMIVRFKYKNKDNNIIFYYMGKGFLLDADFNPIYCTFVEFDYNPTKFGALNKRISNVTLNLEVIPDVITNQSDFMYKSIIKYILPVYASEEFTIGFNHANIVATTTAKIIINKINPFLEEPVKPSINNHQILVKEALKHVEPNMANLFNV